MPLPKGRPSRKQLIASALSIARKKRRADGGPVLSPLPTDGDVLAERMLYGSGQYAVPHQNHVYGLMPGLASQAQNVVNRNDSMPVRAMRSVGLMRADGGDVPSFPDMVAQNPRGWGTAPPPMPEPTPGQIQAAREYLISRDAAGNPDADAADAVEPLAPAISGYNMAKQSGQDLARGNYGRGAGEAALAVAPYVGGQALNLATKYGSKLAAPAAGLATMFTPSEAGPEGPEGEITRLETQKAKLMATRDAATSQFLDASQGVSNELTGKGKTGKPGKGPASDALAAQASTVGEVAKQYTQDLQKIQDRIDELHYQLTPKYTQEQKLIQDNIDARKPWYERTGIPGFEQAANWGPWLGAAALTRGKFNKISGEGETLLGNAQGAASIGDRTAAQVALDAWKKGSGGITGEYAKAAGKAALLPGAIRTTGNAGDAVFGPQVKDAQGNVQPGGAKQQAQHTFGRMFGSEGWQGAGEEWGPQALQGAEATALGAMLARRAPSGGISGELSNLRGVDSSLAPDQMAVEIAKRRAMLPDSGASTPTNPTPLWPQTMKAESSRPALPSPAAKALSGTMPPPTPARPTTPLRIAPPTVEPPPPVLASPPSVSPAPAPEVVKPKKYPDGSWRHPGTGNYVKTPATASKAKPTANKAQAQPKPKAAAQDDVPLDKNGIPIKPPKEFDPDDPINRGRKAGGGVFSHAMSLARKYAKGGAVVGAMVGNTGGRADKLPIDVPSGAYILPSDYVSGLPGAGSNTLAGMKILEQRFGPSHKMAAGGAATPIVISHGEFIVSPEQVAKLGGGDLSTGHRKLDHEVMQARQNHIATLSRLPPPAR